jgi:adenylyltransferase/sulfurtransferase
VELSNLQRQVLYETGDIGRLKVEAARDRVGEINPEVHVEIFAQKLTPRNAQAWVERFDVTLDGSDNFATRFALAEACHRAGRSLVSAAISGFSGQVSTFKSHLGPPHPCYRCLVPSLPGRERNCAQEGIVGALAGVMGSLQALEAVKELLAIGVTLSGRLLVYDALAGAFRTVLLPRDERCPLCAASPA